MNVTKAIEKAGYGLSGNIGGIKKTTYFTPDGRKIIAVSQMRDWVRKNDKGDVIAQGTRDANLDKGWLLQMPSVLKPYCRFCDGWHDTQVEVEACGIQQKKVMEQAAVEGSKEELAAKDSQLAEMQRKIDALTLLVEKVLGKDGVK